MKILGIILIVIGIGLSIYGGITFFTTERVAKVGKLEIDKEKPHTISWSPIAGVVLIAVGGVVLWQGAKNNN